MRNLTKIERNNILFHFLDGAVFVFAMSITSIQTVIPVFIKELGASELIVGFFPALWGLGVNLPQVFYMPGGNLSNIRHVVLRIALINRLAFLALGLIIYLFLAGLQAEIQVGLVLFILLITAFSGSFSVPVWFHFFSKTVPIHYRGRLVAARQFAGSVLGVGGGWLIAEVIKNFSFPRNYGILFILTFFFMMVSYGALRKVKEPKLKLTDTEAKFGLRSAIGILKKDKNFRNYLFSDMVGQWISTIIPFFAIYGLRQFNMEQGSIGYFTSVFMGGMLLANIALGLVADLYGHKANIIIYHFSVVISCVVAIYAGNIVIFSLAFFISGFTQAALGISRVSIILEMTSEENQRLYISAIGSLSSPFVISGLVQGYIIMNFGYMPVFAINILLGLAGLFIVIRMVQEPRRKFTHE